MSGEHTESSGSRLHGVTLSKPRSDTVEKKVLLAFSTAGQRVVQNQWTVNAASTGNSIGRPNWLRRLLCNVFTNRVGGCPVDAVAAQTGGLGGGKGQEEMEDR